MKPSIGRIVHIVDPDLVDPIPAIICYIDADGAIAGTAFSSERNPYTFGPLDYEHDDPRQEIFWRWPPRVPE